MLARRRDATGVNVEGNDETHCQNHGQNTKAAPGIHSLVCLDEPVAVTELLLLEMNSDQAVEMMYDSPDQSTLFFGSWSYFAPSGTGGSSRSPPNIQYTVSAAEISACLTMLVKVSGD